MRQSACSQLVPSRIGTLARWSLLSLEPPVTCTPFNINGGDLCPTFRAEDAKVGNGLSFAYEITNDF